MLREKYLPQPMLNMLNRLPPPGHKLAGNAHVKATPVLQALRDAKAPKTCLRDVGFIMAWCQTVKGLGFGLWD